MKNKIIIATLAVLFAVFAPVIFTDRNEKAPVENHTDEASDRTEETEDILEISVLMGDKSVKMDIEEYLVGVVAGEMPVSFEDEAIKAQAVAARTYTLYKLWVEQSANHDETVCTDAACCKAYADEASLREKWGDDYDGNITKIRALVWSTQGVYMVYENEPVLAVFHSSSSGKTENSGNVWNKDVPYLASVESPESSENVKNYISVKEIEYDDFKMRFLKEYPEAEFSENREEWITDIVYSDSGRINSVRIGGVTVRGTKLRALYELRSTAVTVEAGEKSIKFTVTGYGHGVGMSQYGANTMAQEGSTWQEILKWYYTGIDFATLLGTI
ncbi:MAG: stage II sporulation protein D [Oscillospiraceae bacterium]|nr:stage II sporulation protein D [Oscillospiraceae bacterium]